MEEVWKFLKDSGVYYLATCDGDQPRVRPFGTAEIFENRLYIQTGKKKDVYKQIERNKNIEMCAFKEGKWIRISGELIPDDRIEAKRDMLDKNPMLRNMYNENDDNTIVLYLNKGRAVISSFTDEDKVIEF